MYYFAGAFGSGSSLRVTTSLRSANSESSSYLVNPMESSLFRVHEV